MSICCLRTVRFCQ